MDEIRRKYFEVFERVMGQIMQRSMRSFWQYTKEQGLSMTQMVALRHIHYNQDCNISQISEELGVTTAASSQLLDRLVQQGLIARRENPNDRRHKQLVLTEKGKRILTESTVARQQWLYQLVDRLSVEEMEQIIQALELITERMKEIEPV
ncbi:MAG: MarR family transcriptional regulator [Bellilinea sp.]|nr:MarR family transcriptional regulator [Bellilinea sp.]